MATTKEFNISSNAVTVLNQTAEATKNAKQELKELQKEMLSMDANSAEFQKAAGRAGELKDQINDAADAIRTSTGPALESINNTLGIMSGQIANLDFGGLGQSLTSMGRAIGKVNVKALKEELNGLATGFVNLARVILTNPIMWIAGVAALIAVNFDKIIAKFPSIEKGLTGISTQEKNLLDLQTKRAEQAKKNYDNISATENILKLQGKTEKEIRDLKTSALKTAIEEAQVRRVTARDQAISQVETAKRNRKILEGIITFIEAPLFLILSAVDGIAALVGQSSNLAGGLIDFQAKLLVDPEEQSAELQKSLDEQEAAITEMKNNLAGLQLEQKKADADAAKAYKDAQKSKSDAAKSAREKAEEERQKELEANAIAAAKELEQEKKIAEDKLKLEQDLIRAKKDARGKELYDLELKKEQELQTWEGAEEDKVLILEKYRLLELDINKKYDDELLQQQLEAQEKQKAEDEKAKEEAKKREEDLAKAKLEAEKQLYEARWGLATASVDLLGTLFAKNKKAADVAFALEKGLAVAKIIVDTQAEIAGYYAANAAAGPAGMAVASAQALAAKIRAATSIATIAGTTVSKFMNGGGSAASGATGGTGGGGSASGTQAPSPANFAFLGNQPNQQAPLQAYVVSGQVSSNLEAQQLINNQARLGG